MFYFSRSKKTKEKCEIADQLFFFFTKEDMLNVTKIAVGNLSEFYW